MNVRNFMAPSHGVAIGIGSGEGSGGATRQSASATSKNFLQARIFARNLKVNTNPSEGCWHSEEISKGVNHRDSMKNI